MAQAIKWQIDQSQKALLTVLKKMPKHELEMLVKRIEAGEINGMNLRFFTKHSSSLLQKKGVKFMYALERVNARIWGKDDLEGLKEMAKGVLLTKD